MSLGRTRGPGPAGPARGDGKRIRWSLRRAAATAGRPRERARSPSTTPGAASNPPVRTAGRKLPQPPEAARSQAAASALRAAPPPAPLTAGPATRPGSRAGAVRAERAGGRAARRRSSRAASEANRSRRGAGRGRARGAPGSRVPWARGRPGLRHRARSRRAGAPRRGSNLKYQETPGNERENKLSPR